MSVELLTIFFMWASGIFSFVAFTPKNRKRRLIFAVLICQSLTWLNTLLHVKFNLLVFPVREFPKATDLLVTTEYFFYPLVCGFYIIFEPRLNYFFRHLYLALWISGLTIFDVMIEKYTNLLEYVHYEWYWTWIDFFGLFIISNMMYSWFFKDKKLFRKEMGTTG